MNQRLRPEDQSQVHVIDVDPQEAMDEAKEVFVFDAGGRVHDQYVIHQLVVGILVGKGVELFLGNLIDAHDEVLLHGLRPRPQQNLNSHRHSPPESVYLIACSPSQITGG